MSNGVSDYNQMPVSGRDDAPVTVGSSTQTPQTCFSDTKVSDLKTTELMQLIQAAVSASVIGGRQQGDDSSDDDESLATSKDSQQPKKKKNKLKKSKAASQSRRESENESVVTVNVHPPVLRRTASMYTKPNKVETLLTNSRMPRNQSASIVNTRRSSNATSSNLRSHFSGSVTPGSGDVNTVQMEKLGAPIEPKGLKSYGSSQMLANESDVDLKKIKAKKLTRKSITYHRRLQNELYGQSDMSSFDYIKGVNNCDPNRWILCAGLLQKRRDGKLREGWAHRFFILSGKRLMYYLVPKKLDKYLLGELRGSIKLTDIESVSTSDSHKGFFIHIDINNSGVKKSNAMKTFQNVSHITLWADSFLTGSAWARAILEARDNAFAVLLLELERRSESMGELSDGGTVAESVPRLLTRQLSVSSIRSIDGSSASVLSPMLSPNPSLADRSRLVSYNSDSSMDSSLLNDDSMLLKQNFIQTVNWKRKFEQEEEKCNRSLHQVFELHKNVVEVIESQSEEPSWTSTSLYTAISFSIALLLLLMLGYDIYMTIFPIMTGFVLNLAGSYLMKQKYTERYSHILFQLQHVSGKLNRIQHILTEESDDEEGQKDGSQFMPAPTGHEVMEPAGAGSTVDFNANLSTVSNEKKLQPGQTSEYGRDMGKASPKFFWSETAGENFKVRCGPNYSKNKKKTVSAPTMYDIISADIVKDNKIIKNILDHFEVPKPRPCDDVEAIKSIGLPRVLVVHLQMFLGSPSLLGKQENDAGCSFVQYFSIKPEVVKKYKNNDLTPAMELYKQFIDNFDTDESMRKRFKGIAVVDNMAERGVLKRLRGYNGKPFILNKCVSLRKLDRENYEYFLLEVNVRTFGFVAKKLMSSFMDELKHLKIISGGVIQAESDDQMPEAMLFSSRIENMDLHKNAVHLDDLKS